jgi:hypothetical protein
MDLYSFDTDFEYLMMNDRCDEVSLFEYLWLLVEELLVDLIHILNNVWVFRTHYDTNEEIDDVMNDHIPI